MSKYEKVIYQHLPHLVSQLDQVIVNSAMSMKLVDESTIDAYPYKVSIKVYDKYFMRNSSRASLNLTVLEDGRTTHVVAIGSGGGQGAIFNFSWGAEKELVQEVQVFLEKMVIREYIINTKQIRTNSFNYMLVLLILNELSMIR